MKMKRSYVTLIVIVAVVLVLFFWIKGMYNSMVRTDETVSQAWAQVENVYQRRADLVPNLVATVKGYAEHESSTLEAVVEARAKATQATVDPSTLSEEELARFMSAQNELGTAIGRLLVSVERYPDLKANQNFLELQAQLEGTENRITVERQKFNEAAHLRRHVRLREEGLLRGFRGSRAGTRSQLRVMTAGDLLRKESKEALVRAIQTAEKNTSGEIRVHLEQVCKGDPCLRAAYVFSKLGMFRTKDRNGVLIYLALKSHKFAIIGDSGINEKVGAGFWNEVKDGMAADFRSGDFTGGMSRAVLAVGEKLKAFFPYQKDDVNELPDDISYEDNQ